MTAAPEMAVAAQRFSKNFRFFSNCSKKKKDYNRNIIKRALLKTLGSSQSTGVFHRDLPR